MEQNRKEKNIFLKKSKTHYRYQRIMDDFQSKFGLFSRICKKCGLSLSSMLFIWRVAQLERYKSAAPSKYYRQLDKAANRAP